MLFLIINPLSGARGRSQGASRAALATRLLDARGIEGRVCVTERAGHAAELTRQALAEGASLVCAWGGDGTINEVAGVLVHTSIPLGVIPEGSGNGFARELGVYLKPEQALDVALNGRERLIDAGQMNGRLFFNLAGIGLDATIAALFNYRSPQRRGFLRYVWLGWQQLVTYDPSAYRIQTESEQLDLRAIMIVTANLRQYGNGAYIAPDADAEDGRLDLVIIGARSMTRAFLLTPRLFTRSLHKANNVLTKRVTQVSISSEAPLVCHVDGEPFQAGARVTITVEPKALRVKVPERA
ncbi:MAG TPA: diacylglycerol kinase family protein [Vicinamibacterales bacterium]|jgi:YegS/Rv2252/BmrU family lipid kinase